MKCAQGCTACKNQTNICLMCETDYVLNSVTKKCIPTKFCHSTCSSCTVKMDSAKCSACSSTLTALAYNSLSGEGVCSLPATNKAQILTTINKNSVLQSSYLNKVTYNGVAQSASGTVLGSLLYNGQNVVEFMSLTSNTVIFEMFNLPIHQKLQVRARVYT